VVIPLKPPARLGCNAEAALATKSATGAQRQRWMSVESARPSYDQRSDFHSFKVMNVTTTSAIGIASIALTSAASGVTRLLVQNSTLSGHGLGHRTNITPGPESSRGPGRRRDLIANG
jgi:hypothetical protein